MKTNTIAVNLNDRKLRKYGKSDEAEIIGEFYNYKTPEPTLKTIQHIQKKIDCPEDLVRHLQSLTGFYSLVIRDKNKIFAVVDITRSIPLFYGQGYGKFFLSDNAEWVRDQVGDLEMDSLAKEEFLLTGYVTGRDTLYPNVKQLQAGEYLIAEETDIGVSIQHQRYYRFLHKEPSLLDEAELSNKLENATKNAIRRLIEYANGRQIVLPLSGGYDSRLIALLLKHFDYKNVLCFTYGVLGNKEAEYSRRVAKSLGFAWTFVEYSNVKWATEWSSLEAQEYREMAANHTSLPHIQDWLAIKTLVARKDIHLDAIVAPGHSGDFVAGSHIPNFVFSKKTHSQDDLLQALIKDNYSNVPQAGMAICKEFGLESRLLDRINLPFDGTDVGLADLYETWDWQERQAKYIVNSVRVYDQFKLDWWLPLWDAEFVKFWEGVPLALRKERIWFKNWITEQYLSVSAHDEENQVKNNASDTSILYGLAKRLVKRLPESTLTLIKKMRRNKIYNSHLLAFGGLINPDDYITYTNKNYNLIGMYSVLFIKGKWGSIQAHSSDKYDNQKPTKSIVKP
ncbi:asparagine synthase-related protein [Pseudomonas silesiensis]|uniref:asparagine synthase-related protein n=1 Tax=Pseudomonas silesiensis TaxID=1853130 RepID=UPI0034D5719A